MASVEWLKSIKIIPNKSIRVVIIDFFDIYIVFLRVSLLPRLSQSNYSFKPIFSYSF